MSAKEIVGYIHIVCGGVSLGLLFLILTHQISEQDLHRSAAIIITFCLANTALYFYGRANWRGLD